MSVCGCNTYLRSNSHTQALNTYRNLCLPMQPSSNCKVKEEITSGLSLRQQSSWTSAVCPHKHSIDQCWLVCVNVLRSLDSTAHVKCHSQNSSPFLTSEHIWRYRWPSIPLKPDANTRDETRWDPQIHTSIQKETERCLKQSIMFTRLSTALTIENYCHMFTVK